MSGNKTVLALTLALGLAATIALLSGCTRAGYPNLGSWVSPPPEQPSRVWNQRMDRKLDCMEKGYSVC